MAKNEQRLEKLLQASEEVDGFEPEYRALWESCALVCRSDRGAVAVSGDRAAEMLNGLLTNRVTDLDGVGRHAMLLSAKGRVLTDLRILPRSHDLLLDVPRSGRDNLLSSFEKYLPPIYAQYRDLTDELGQLGLYGSEAAGTLADVFGDRVPAAVHLVVTEADWEGEALLLVRNRRTVADGFELFVPSGSRAPVAAALLEAVDARGGAASGFRALEVARVEAGVPRYGCDIDESNLAQETGLEDEAISHDKGCYLGQEVVARVHFRGHVNRRLVGLRFGPRRPDPGAKLRDGEKVVGHVTSSVVSPRLGPIGLGYVRREIAANQTLEWAEGPGGGHAEVVSLPFLPSSV